MKTKRSAWDGPRKESWRMASIFDPHFVDGMPSNEERLRHLDFYLREHDTAPIVSGGKKGMQGCKHYQDEITWIEEYDTTIEFNCNPDFNGIRKVGV